jgi:hypothetical protein
MKQMPKYRALYYGEGLRAPVTVGLLADDALPGKKAIPQ